MTPSRPQKSCRRLILAVLLLLVGRSLPCRAADHDLPLELTPYRMQLWLAFGDDARLTSAFRRRLLDKVAVVAARHAGQMWELRVAENGWLLPAGYAQLARMSLADAPAAPDAQSDWLFIATLTGEGAAFRLTMRGWNAATEQFGEPVERTVYDPRELPTAVVALASRLVRPLARIEDVDKQRVSLTLQAGEFPPPDPQAVLLRPGDLLVPYYRFYNRDRELLKIQPIPWTYLTVETIDRSRVVCRFDSGLARPLGGKRRGRIELIAVGIRPRYPATELKLTPVTNPAQPLVAHRVEVTPVEQEAPNQSDDEAQKENGDPPLRLLSDRAGTVTIPADPSAPLVWVTIHSGKARLARLPFVPGVVRRTSVALPDDSRRLEVEGALARLHGRLLVTVAQRSALAAAVRRLASSGDAEGMSRQLAEIRKLPDAEYYLSQLGAIRVPAEKAMEEAGNRLAAARIRRLAEGTADAIRSFLSEDKLDALREEAQERLRLYQADAAELRAVEKEIAGESAEARDFSPPAQD